MGIIDDKKTIFTEIGAYNSAKDNIEIPENTNSLSSINNSKEPVPFFLDLLTTLNGSQALQNTTGELMTSFVKDVEPTLKDDLKKQTTNFNSDSTVTSGFVNGYRINATDIDSFGKLKTDPASQMGGVLYADNDNNFDKKSYEAIINPGTDVEYNGLDIKYNESDDTFTYKPTNSSVTIGDFFNIFISGLIIINYNEFTSRVLNLIFGTISSNQNKTEQQLIAEEKLTKTLEKYVSESESTIITDDELIDIEKKAKNKLDGINYVDVGCGLIRNNVTLNTLDDLITNTKNSNDPYGVGVQYGNLIDNSGDDEQSEGSKKNKGTIKDGFFKKLINNIVMILVESVTVTPQIRALFAIYNGMKNNDNLEVNDPVTDLNNQQNLVNCLTKTTKATINEFLFDLIKKEMLKLIIPVSKAILMEKVNQYINIIKSLIGFS